MALTRALLKGMGLTDEQVNAVIEEHTTVKDALKKQLTTLTEEKNALENINAENAELRAKLKEAEDFKQKYEDVNTRFENYKQDIANKETFANLKNAYKQLLEENHINDKQIKSILEITKFDKLKLDKDGKLENIDELNKEINEKYAGFIVETTTQRSTKVPTPPSNVAEISKEKILEEKDTAKRQKMIAEHIDLFT